jgi:hypothetical protein
MRTPQALLDVAALEVTTSRAIHELSRTALIRFPMGETMKSLAVIAVMVLTCMAAGCVHEQAPIDGAKTGIGSIPKTRSIEI